MRLGGGASDGGGGGGDVRGAIRRPVTPGLRPAGPSRRRPVRGQGWGGAGEFALGALPK